MYPNINCNEIKLLYKDTTLKHFAILEWHYIRELQESKSKISSSTRALECFCKDLSVLEAFNKAFTTIESNSKALVQGKICYDWMMGIVLNNLLNYLVNGTIVMMGIFL